MTRQELRQRTLRFAVAVFQFVRPLFRDADTRHIAYQALKASTSVAANYRAACLARSDDEWVAKLGVVREESDESDFWLAFIDAVEIAPGRADLRTLSGEADELVRIFAAAYRTSKENQSRARKEKRRSRKRNSELTS